MKWRHTGLLCIVLTFLAVQGHHAVVATAAPTAPISAEAVRDSLSVQFARVEDFKVQVLIDVSLPRLRMPRKQIDLAFKQPDYTRIESRGFAVAPRTGLVMAPDQLLDNLQEIRSVEHGEFRGDSHVILTGTVHPDSFRAPMWDVTSDPGTLITRLWIDPARWIIRHMETRLDTARLIAISVEYTEAEPGIWLPETTEITITLPENLPVSREMDFPPGRGATEQQPQKPLRGTMQMKFRGYRVNRGIPDDFFQQEQQ